MGCQVIWNMEMRAELLGFVEDQRLHGKTPAGTYDSLGAARLFSFSCLASEIQVSDLGTPHQVRNQTTLIRVSNLAISTEVARSLSNLWGSGHFS